MRDVVRFSDGSKNPANLIKVFKHNLLFSRENPDYFYPSGIWVFTGAQGSGKTLSMINTLKHMLKEYPKALVVSNLDIKGVDYVRFTSYEQLERISNGIYGVIFVLDEIHTLWNSLESKDVPISEMACFCQMRKDRRVILGTSQVRSRVAKPIREQLQYIIDCKCFFGCVQSNVILDPVGELEENGTLAANVIDKQLWFHHPNLYDSYDTLFKIRKPVRKGEKEKC